MNTNFMVVLSSPSGAGKTTIARALIENDPQLKFSVSYTTRPKRPGEVDTKDYHFVDVETFQEMQAKQEFLECAHVFDRRYGTGRKDTFQAFDDGYTLILDIDWQGAKQIQSALPDHAVSVFILPPSLKVLYQRLRNRNQDSADVIDTRMAQAMDEISHWREYDYILVNHDIEQSVANLRTIIDAERLRRRRWKQGPQFIEDLNAEFLDTSSFFRTRDENQ